MKQTYARDTQKRGFSNFIKQLPAFLESHPVQLSVRIADIPYIFSVIKRQSTKVRIDMELLFLTAFWHECFFRIPSLKQFKNEGEPWRFWETFDDCSEN
jgi:hypothetical protein